MRTKMYRQILSVMLAVLCLFGMTACGSKTAAPTETATEAPAATTEAVTEAEAVSTETVDPDVQAIIDRGVLRVGVKNAVIGFGFQDPITGEYSGMEIDIANALAEQLGVDVEFTTVTAATRTELLDSGDIDCVLATFTITEERKQSWDFTTPYYTDHVTVLVEDTSGIKTLADLKDKLVGVSLSLIHI